MHYKDSCVAHFEIYLKFKIHFLAWWQLGCDFRIFNISIIWYHKFDIHFTQELDTKIPTQDTKYRFKVNYQTNCTLSLFRWFFDVYVLISPRKKINRKISSIKKHLDKTTSRKSSWQLSTIYRHLLWYSTINSKIYIISNYNYFST